jgi:hypothetical protein
MVCRGVGFILSDSGNTTRGVQLPNEKIGCEKVRCITKLTSSDATVKQFYIPIEMKILMESSFRLTCEPGVSRSPENVRGIITLKASIMRLAVPRFMISEHPFPWLFPSLPCCRFSLFSLWPIISILAFMNLQFSSACWFSWVGTNGLSCLRPH